MPPKRARKGTVVLSQKDQIEAAIEPFARELRKVGKMGKTVGSIPVPSAALKTINSILKVCRADAKLINQPCVADFVRLLEDDEGRNLCQDLEPEAFCTALRVILQMESCKLTERGIYLLAASLFSDSQDLESNDLDGRKDTIGTNCLLQLLDFFVNGKKESGMRRWAGLLCIQLVTNCESNHSKLQDIPDDTRRGIGRQVIEETDEILRVIYAQLVRVMIDEGTPLEMLFPEHYEDNVYAGFPISSQGKAGWGIQFQHYLDSVSLNATMEIPEQVGYLFFAASVVLTPGHQLGAKHHNAFLYVDGTQVSFLSTSRDGYFDTILDIPLSLISGINYSKGNESQVDSQRVLLHIAGVKDEDNSVLCYLDSKAVRISMVAFTIDSKCMDSFEAAILDCQDCIGKSSLERSAYGSSQNGPRIKKVVSLDLGDSQARTQKTSHSYLGEANETYAPRESQQVPGSGEEPSQHQDPRSKADPDTSESSVDQVSVEHSQAEEDLYNATPEKTQTKFATPEVEPIEPKPKLKPVTARGRKPVKPKAKPPIVPGRNALDSQLATAKLKSQAAKIQPATNYDGIAPKKTDTQSKPGASSKKLLPSTSTTNATKGGVKLKDPFRTVPAGKNSTKTISQANVKPTAKKPSEIGIAKSKQVALAHVFDPAYNFSDEIIATPDINDACAPKVSKTKLNDSPAKTATRSAASQSASNETKADKPVVLPHKRYSRPIKATGIIADGKDDDQPVDAKSKSTKESAKAKPGLLQAGSSEPETSNKANAKKRQSAPAALPATRKSQRAAALAAKDKMQGIDDRHDEDEIEASLPSKLKSNIAQEKKADETQEHKKSDSPSFSEDPAMIDLQAEDARSLGLVAGESPILQQGHDEDLYGASPRVPQQKPTPVPNLPKKLASPTATDEKKARNSGIDLANKLIDSLGDLESEPERHDEPESHVMKKPATIEGDTRSRAPQRYEEITDKEQSPSKGDEAPLSIGINEIAASSATPSAPEAPKSPALEERDPKVLPNAIFPPPAAQETIETEPETQIITNVLQTVPKQSFLAQPFHDGLISASQNADKVAVEEVISTEVRHIALNDSKKRKAVPARLTVMKRRRADQEETQVVEEHIPEIKVPAATTEVPNKPKSQPPSLVRKSPQLAARSAQLVGQLKIIAPEVSSAFKDPARKPKVINFTGRGPRNQGMVSAAKLKPATEPMGNQDEASPAAVHVADRKRKREAADFVELVSPSKKKLNSSPMDVQENDIMASQLESSTYKQIVQPKQERQRLVSRPSSQASRVDRNGSPKAIEGQIDHFGKLREKLASQGQYEPQESQTVPDTRTAVCEKPTTRPRRASQIFGPKISLGNKLKGRPSSPEEPNSRYIAHGENQGVYTDVDTKMVIEEKKILPDPFIERSRKSSTFIERLQSSSSKEHTAAKIQSKQMLDDRVAKPVQAILATVNRSSTEEDLLGLPREERVLDRGERKSGLMAQPARVKKPLYEVSSPNDMTSISSFGSQSSDVARTPLEEVPALNERWNLAVRPHYDSLGHAVHRIADELMIRLSGEEDRMGLLVNQYKENGMKILDAMSKQREIERESISRSLERKKSEIASVYTESRNVMMEMDGNRRGDSASQFEIEWRRKQSVIRKQIAEGQQLSEN